MEWSLDRMTGGFYRCRVMNRDQIRQAIESGSPFVIKTADGKEYEVPHRDFISIAPRASVVVVWDTESESGEFDVLSMLAMTGLRRKDSSIVREEGEGD